MAAAKNRLGLVRRCGSPLTAALPPRPRPSAGGHQGRAQPDQAGREEGQGASVSRPHLLELRMPAPDVRFFPIPPQRSGPGTQGLRMPAPRRERLFVLFPQLAVQGPMGYRCLSQACAMPRHRARERAAAGGGRLWRAFGFEVPWPGVQTEGLDEQKRPGAHQERERLDPKINRKGKEVAYGTASIQARTVLPPRRPPPFAALNSSPPPPPPLSSWEDPNVKGDADVGGAFGDNDPLDVVEIGAASLAMGSVTPVKPLGVLSVRDSFSFGRGGGGRGRREGRSECCR